MSDLDSNLLKRDENIVTIWAAMVATLFPPHHLYFRRNSWEGEPEKDVVLVYCENPQEFPNRMTLRRSGKVYIPTEEDMLATDWDTYNPPRSTGRGA